MDAFMTSVISGIIIVVLTSCIGIIGFTIKKISAINEETVKQREEINTLKNDVDKLSVKTNELENNAASITELKISIKYIEENIKRIINKLDAQ